MSTDYLAVTELSGDQVAPEQVERICHRYYWAGEYCRGRDVLEVACGTGQGAGYLSSLAASYRAGDFSEEILSIARSHYGRRIDFRQFDAQAIPYANDSFEVVILFEALYYLPFPERFAAECRRVLRPGGKVLLATANKDLFDFNPSPHSHAYYGAAELGPLFAPLSFRVECFGSTPVSALSWRQRALRPIKKLAVGSGLMPGTMAGKKLLKRLVYGSLVPMPAEIGAGMAPYAPPAPLPPGRPDRLHKVIYCVASLSSAPLAPPAWQGKAGSGAGV